MKKTLFLELVALIMIVFTFYATKGLTNKVVTPQSNQIIQSGEVNIALDENNFTSTLIEETDTESIFKVSHEVEMYDNSHHLDDYALLILDTRSPNFSELKEMAIRFVDELKQKDICRVIKIITLDDRSYYSILDYDNYENLIRPIAAIEKRYDMYDGLHLALNKISSDERIQNFIVLFSDMNDYSIENMEMATKKENVHIYDYNTQKDVSKKINDYITSDIWFMEIELSDKFEFLGIINNDINNRATYDEKMHKVTWNISQSYEGRMQCEYYVRLKNEEDSFISYHEYEVVKNGTLSYFINSSKEYALPQLSAEGYLSTIQFINKSSITNELIDGATFSLAHDGNCTACANSVGVEISDFIVMGEDQGSVTFKDVPSGHNYILSQVTPNNAYELNKETCSVAVLFGQVYFNGKEDIYIFENIPKHASTLDLSFECEEVRDLEVEYPYDIFYQVTDATGIALEGVEIERADSNGKIVFDAIQFNKTGIYNYRIHCMNRGLETNELYVIVNVTSKLLEGNDQLEATVTYYDGSQKNENKIVVSD